MLSREQEEGVRGALEGAAENYEQDSRRAPEDYGLETDERLDRASALDLAREMIENELAEGGIEGAVAEGYLPNDFLEHASTWRGPATADDVRELLRRLVPRTGGPGRPRHAWGVRDLRRRLMPPD